jgi:hypothetical protein
MPMLMGQSSEILIHLFEIYRNIHLIGIGLNLNCF